ncbi:molybdopterin-guanine dinucleotide biosynthesis protein A [Methanohalophilus levihalophilus]|uniref:molybdenum cofactor guanylyltransferase n=1 Tax=Methanohalophilus levihalophilus TaxID=1431282 RepID=UPI001AE8B686|nr:molybdenum cofactor guanylyltransferase [Methanohalophilus levihalophilus]MBP2031205.1 molybdopterin-guanine dinucleotide biosynthesis protein A [Methanohalophilus levihalophilus]
MQLTSLILAGGKAERLENREKALLLLDETPLLTVITDSLKAVSSEIIFSLRDEDQRALLSPLLQDSKVVFDSFKGKGPLAGILEGFKASSNDYVFVTACDMPFVNLDVVEHLFKAAQGHDAALIRKSDGRFQSIYAVYRARSMIPEIEKCLAEGKNFILAPVFKLDDVVAVDISEISKIDPDLRFLVNINTSQDLKKEGISIVD